MQHRTLTYTRSPFDSAQGKSSRPSREVGGEAVYPEGRRRGAAGGHGPARELRSTKHETVMLGEAVEFLNLQKGDLVVDATYGAGGHSAAIRKAAKVKLIAFDADLSTGGGQAPVIHANFADMESVLGDLGVAQVNKVLFDLGWNRGQLASGRGFSFLTDEPLNMSYGPKPRSGFTAAEVLNTWSEKALADALYGYGEERYAKRVAAAVAARREVKPFETTFELVETIRDAVPARYRHLKLHFATRSFQALRIAVNDEYGALKAGLAGAWHLLAPGGRIVVIIFHSGEDRIVKNFFKERAKEGGVLITKKPLVPTRAEVAKNPAARSAKLRAIEKKLNA